jgi:ABC-type uncharacterized transport system permease subunit
MSNQICKQVDMVFIHQGNLINKELQFVDKQISHVLLRAEVQLLVFMLVVQIIVCILKEAEVGHHLKVVASDNHRHIIALGKT